MFAKKSPAVCTSPDITESESLKGGPGNFHISQYPQSFLSHTNIWKYGLRKLLKFVCKCREQLAFVYIRVCMYMSFFKCILHLIISHRPLFQAIKNNVYIKKNNNNNVYIMCVHVYVFMCVYMCVYISIHTHTHSKYSPSFLCCHKVLLGAWVVTSEPV